MLLPIFLLCCAIIRASVCSETFDDQYVEARRSWRREFFGSDRPADISHEDDDDTSYYRRFYINPSVNNQSEYTRQRARERDPLTNYLQNYNNKILANIFNHVLSLLLEIMYYGSPSVDTEHYLLEKINRYTQTASPKSHLSAKIYKKLVLLEAHLTKGRSVLRDKTSEGSHWQPKSFLPKLNLLPCREALDELIAAAHAEYLELVKYPNCYPETPSQKKKKVNKFILGLQSINPFNRYDDIDNPHLPTEEKQNTAKPERSDNGVMSLLQNYRPGLMITLPSNEPLISLDSASNLASGPDDTPETKLKPELLVSSYIPKINPGAGLNSIRNEFITNLHHANKLAKTIKQPEGNPLDEIMLVSQDIPYEIPDPETAYELIHQAILSEKIKEAEQKWLRGHKFKLNKQIGEHKNSLKVLALESLDSNLIDDSAVPIDENNDINKDYGKNVNLLHKNLELFKNNTRIRHPKKKLINTSVVNGEGSSKVIKSTPKDISEKFVYVKPAIKNIDSTVRPNQPKHTKPSQEENVSLPHVFKVVESIIKVPKKSNFLVDSLTNFNKVPLHKDTKPKIIDTKAKISAVLKGERTPTSHLQPVKEPFDILPVLKHIQEYDQLKENSHELYEPVITKSHVINNKTSPKIYNKDYLYLQSPNNDIDEKYINLQPPSDEGTGEFVVLQQSNFSLPINKSKNLNNLPLKRISKKLKFINLPSNPSQSEEDDDIDINQINSKESDSIDNNSDNVVPKKNKDINLPPFKVINVSPVLISKSEGNTEHLNKNIPYSNIQSQQKHLVISTSAESDDAKRPGNVLNSNEAKLQQDSVENYDSKAMIDLIQQIIPKTPQTTKNKILSDQEQSVPTPRSRDIQEDTLDYSTPDLVRLFPQLNEVIVSKSKKPKLTMNKINYVTGSKYSTSDTTHAKEIFAHLSDLPQLISKLIVLLNPKSKKPILINNKLYPAPESVEIISTIPVKNIQTEAVTSDLLSLIAQLEPVNSKSTTSKSIKNKITAGSGLKEIISTPNVSDSLEESIVSTNSVSLNMIPKLTSHQKYKKLISPASLSSTEIILTNQINDILSNPDLSSNLNLQRLIQQLIVLLYKVKHSETGFNSQADIEQISTEQIQTEELIQLLVETFQKLCEHPEKKNALIAFLRSIINNYKTMRTETPFLYLNNTLKTNPHDVSMENQTEESPKIPNNEYLLKKNISENSYKPIKEYLAETTRKEDNAKGSLGVGKVKLDLNELINNIFFKDPNHNLKNIANFADTPKSELNFDLMKSTPDVIELTYVIKKPGASPKYYVKYRIPYHVFASNFRNLLLRKTRPNPEQLFKELNPLTNITEVSPDLKYVKRDELLKMITVDGSYVKAKALKNPTNGLRNDDLKSMLEFENTINALDKLINVDETKKHPEQNHRSRKHSIGIDNGHDDESSEITLYDGHNIKGGSSNHSAEVENSTENYVPPTFPDINNLGNFFLHAISSNVTNLRNHTTDLLQILSNGNVSSSTIKPLNPNVEIGQNKTRTFGGGNGTSTGGNSTSSTYNVRNVTTEKYTVTEASQAKLNKTGLNVTKANVTATSVSNGTRKQH